MRMGLGNSLTLPSNCGIAGVSIPEAHAQLLLHYDDDFEDSSANAAVYNPVGSPALSSAQKVFGAKSLQTGTNRPGYTFPAFSDYDFFDTTPMQLSFRLWMNSISSALWIISSQGGNGDNGWTFRIHSTGNSTELVSFGAAGLFWSSTGLYSANTWHAIRINHDGAGNYRFYLDGALRGGPTLYTGGTPPNKDLRFGAAYDGGAPLSGFMDEILIEKHDDLVITTSSTYEVEELPFVLV